MAKLTGTIPVGAQIDADGGKNIGGGMIVAIFLGAGGDSTNYDIEYSPDDGDTYYPVCDESDTAIQLTYKTGGAMHQINPPIRAPLVRINGDTNEADAALDYEFHTV